MFRKLQLQLTALCIAITGLVLAVLSCICLLISESGIRSQEYASFQSDLDTIFRNLEEQLTLSHTWIRQMEYHHHVALRITDNGVPLFFQSLAENPSSGQQAEITIPETLWQTAADTARTEYDLNLQTPGSPGVLTQHVEFPLSCAHQNYNSSVALIPRSRKNYIGVIVLQPLSQMEARIFRQRTGFLLADLAALALLGIFYWHFTARMIRPLQENRKRQMQFIASASHELRSPLAVILSNVAAVQSGAMPGDEQFLQTIDSEGKRMSRLIIDLLQLAGADNRTWSIRPTKVEMDTLLLQIFENYESMAVSHGLRWEIALPEDPVPPCVCDEERIRQLLSILIDNAFSYTPAGGHVALSLSCSLSGSKSTDLRISRRMPFAAQKEINYSSREYDSPDRYGNSEGYGSPDAPSSPAGIQCSQDSVPKQGRFRKIFRKAGSAGRGQLYIAVRDNGPGIPDDQKKTVFERFSRLDKSRSDKSHFGLGLCIAQEIAHLHHGRILLTDTFGGGSTFTFVLPLTTEYNKSHT